MLTIGAVVTPTVEFLTPLAAAAAGTPSPCSSTTTTTTTRVVVTSNLVTRTILTRTLPISCSWHICHTVSGVRKGHFLVNL